MNKPHILRFHPDVVEDLRKIHSWYEDKLVGLGDDFIQIFYSSIKLIIDNPFQLPKTYKNYYRYLFRKFPYAIYYTIKDDLIIVMGVFHHSRDPNIIKSTLENRID